MSHTALVVGASGGIGSAVAETVRDLGFNVYGTYFASDSKKLAHKKIEWVQMDVRDEHSIDEALRKIQANGHTLDTVVYAPTIPVKPHSFFQTTWQEIEEHLQVQVKGLVNMVHSCRALIEAKQGMSVVVVLTEYCIGKPPRGLSGYVSAKYALFGLAKSLAVELAPYNVRVNMVLPGMTDTELLKDLPPKLLEISTAHNPLGRIGTPEDVAKAVAFLVSDEARYINGTMITVNGGSVMI